MNHHFNSKRPAFLSLTAVTLAAMLSVSGTQAQTATAADEKQELQQLRATTLALIDALVGQGLLSRERADAIVRQAQQAAAGASPAPAQWGAPLPGAGTGAAAKTVRVPYVPETLRQQMREEIKAEVLAQARQERWGEPGALPDWLSRIRVGGDFRVRSQGEMFDSGNEPASSYGLQSSSPSWWPYADNTTRNRERLSVRARLDVQAQLGEQVTAQLRLSSGSTGSGPTSTSHTLGNGFNRTAVGLDRAWLRWTPPVGFNGLSADFGRMPNPFMATDLTFPDDLNLDGVAARYTHGLAPAQTVSATAGVFPMEELKLSAKDKWLVGAQVSGSFELARGTELKLGLAAYEFRNMAGIRETQPKPTGVLASSTPWAVTEYPASLRQKGNTLINIADPSATAPVWGLASKFRPVNLTAALSTDVLGPYALQFQMDWVRNTGFDINDIRARSGATLTDLKAKTTAAQGRIQLGRAALAKTGDWQVFTGYRYVERDAWIDGLTDTTWHLGGTNYKGWTLGGNYAFHRNFWLGARWTSTRNLDDGVRFLAVPSDPSSLRGLMSSAPLRIEVFQLDLNARF